MKMMVCDWQWSWRR